MNWAQFKDPHCYLCLHGAVEACWFITQGVGGLNTPFCKNNFYRFFRINLGKTRMNEFQNAVIIASCERALMVELILVGNKYLVHVKRTSPWPLDYQHFE